MNLKISCYIIQDLLPTYAEGLVNKNTAEDIEEHFKECLECKEIYQEITENISIETEQVNVEEIDYLKKIKKRITIKSVIGTSILMLIMFYFTLQYIVNNGNMYLYEIFVLLPLFIGFAYYTLFNILKKDKNIGLDFWVTNGFIITASTFLIIFMFLLDNWIEVFKFPFGLKPEQIGPFTHYFVNIMRISITITIIYAIMKGIKKSLLYYIIVSNGISAICMMTAYISVLRSLTDFEDYALSRNMCILIYLEGILITISLLVWMIRRKCFKNN